jgi:hypothetical protein
LCVLPSQTQSPVLTGKINFRCKDKTLLCFHRLVGYGLDTCENQQLIKTTKSNKLKPPRRATNNKPKLIHTNKQTDSKLPTPYKDYNAIKKTLYQNKTKQNQTRNNSIDN